MGWDDAKVALMVLVWAMVIMAELGRYVFRSPLTFFRVDSLDDSRRTRAKTKCSAVLYGVRKNRITVAFRFSLFLA